VNNPDFNYGEFATIKSQVGLNSYKISVKEWVEKTNAIGIQAKAGRYGGTYAHYHAICHYSYNLPLPTMVKRGKLSLVKLIKFGFYN